MPTAGMPSADRHLIKLHRLVRRAGLFESQWYRDRYPAAAAAGGDLLRHFLERGAARGHLPSPLWRGLDADGCAALAERHGKAGRSLWRHMLAQRGPGGDAFDSVGMSGRELTRSGPLTPHGFARALDRTLSTDSSLTLDLLVVDHAMGGGANRYRNERLAEMLGQGGTVGLLTYRLRLDRYLLELCDGETCIIVATACLPELVELMQRLTIERILLNNLASYPDVMEMIQILRRAVLAGGARLDFPVHDFFAVCPSYRLLDDRQEFCGVPPLQRCRACLPKVVLPASVPNSPRDIDAWRTIWAGLLDVTSQIVAFSNSSRELLARAYPGLDPQRIVVQPHDVSYLPARTVEWSTDASLHIGVVGEISFAKGAEVVAALHRELQHRQSPIKLSVIGTLDRQYEAAIPQTGRYRTADLRGHPGGSASMSAWSHRSGPRRSATSQRS